jgi:tetratricopeptide (TPR) repeat protein
VNNLHKSCSFAQTSSTRRCLWTALIVLATLLNVAALSAIAQQAPPHRSTGATIRGSVTDSAGKVVADASVRLKSANAQTPSETRTNAAGAFEFLGLPAGSYALIAEKSGLISPATAVVTLSEDDRKQVALILGSTADRQPSKLGVPSPSSDQPMGFSDTPNFTVAGVTDWTAVGGHGSDSILRTSEDLARETAALKPQGAAPRASGGASKVTEPTESESQLRSALASAPGSFRANHELGAFYLQGGRYHDALPLLEAAYRLDPANDANERDLALAYQETGDLRQAREHVGNLLKRRNDADLDRMAAELDEKLGDPLAAVEKYQQAVSLDPSEQNYFAWGSELLLHRAVWQAAEVFRNGVEAHPNSARLQTALGTALFAGALYDDSARSLCAASDLDPSNSEPYIFMGRIIMASPAPLPCVETKLARFVQQKPDSSLANYLYAMAIWKQHQSSPSDNRALPQVETLLTKAVTIDPKCSDGYLQLGILAASQHHYEKAVQLYTKAIEVDPQLGEAHYRLGVAYDRIGEREKAAQEYQLHDEIEKRQAAAIERQRRDVKQFVVVETQPATSVTH